MTIINERDPFRRRYIAGAELVGSEGYPKIAPTQSLPQNVISFNESGNGNDISSNWVDHFIADSLFERVYNNCDRYISRYSHALGVIGTDFSAHRNMPKWQRSNNIGRNRSIDYYLQQHEIDVIPTVSWAYIEDFEWCLDGLPAEAFFHKECIGELKMGSNGSFDQETGKTLQKFDWKDTGSTLCGIKIIKKKREGDSVGLPTKSASPGSAYVMLDKDGKFKHYAEYGEDQIIRLRLDYGTHNSKRSFHLHRYDRGIANGTITTIASHEKGIIDEELYNKYRRFLKGIDL